MQKINLHHGAGGKQMQEFIKKSILTKLSNGILEKLDDCAVLQNEKNSRLSMTTDSFVVSPLFFKGGDIGRLCVAGTANDLATSGANVHAMSLSFIIEEGMELESLERIIDSIAQTAKEAQIKIVTGDTKVVEKGKGDGLFINTCAIGYIPEGVSLSTYHAQDNDLVILTGNIGEHEVAMMKARELIHFELEIESDVKPLNLLVKALLEKVSHNEIHIIKDPTRGGLAGALLEIAEHSQVSIHLEEAHIPLSPSVKTVCNLTGLDPLYMANEGKYVIIGSENILGAVKEVFGPAAQVIGKIKKEKTKGVFLETSFGSIRRIGDLETLQLPRIC